MQASAKPLKVGFFTNQICLQGTEVAVYDYAHFNEKLFGNTSIVISKNNKIRERGGAKRNQPLALKKFRDRFELILLDDINDLDQVISEKGIDILYMIKKGINDGVFSKVVPTGIHVVFKFYEPHGQIYAYVSKWLAEEMTSGQAPFVPHMIHLPKVQGDLRDELGIPKDAIVFGRYGGVDSFDLEFVHETIFGFVQKNPKAHFLFMHTDDFLNPRKNVLQKLQAIFNKKVHSQIHFLPGSALLERKSKFINSCTAMLHARKRGETFGVACGEFSMHGVPVITFDGRNLVEGFEGCHIEILGDKGLYYKNRAELEDILNGFMNGSPKFKNQDWDAYSKEYAPEIVMSKFKNVFLDPLGEIKGRGFPARN